MLQGDSDEDSEVDGVHSRPVLHSTNDIIIVGQLFRTLVQRHIINAVQSKTVYYLTIMSKKSLQGCCTNITDAQSHTHRHTHTHNRFTALWILSGTTQVSQYQKKHSPTHTCRGHQLTPICLLHLLRSTASSPFNLRARQSFSTISVLGLPGSPPDRHPPHHTPHTLHPTTILPSQHMPTPLQPVLL